MNKFKVGDKVKCIQGSGWGKPLYSGSIYTVKELYADHGVVLEENTEGAWWNTDRFELVPPAPAKPEPVKEQPKPRLRPRQESDQERLVEILEAMVWAAKQGVVIPDAWDDEYDQLRERLNDVYAPQEIMHFSV